MYCDQCGNALDAGQRFCNRCGKEISGPSIAGYPRRSRVQEHVRLLAILWFAMSAISLIGGFVLLVVANTIFLHPQNFGAPEVPTAFLHPFLTVIAIFELGKTAVGFIAAWGLLQRQPWARVLTLVLGFISLIHPPFGTALGIYTLWVLLPSTSEQEYEKYQQASAA